MFTENDRVLSRITQRFFALWEGAGHTVTEKSWSVQAFPGRKSTN